MLKKYKSFMQFTFPVFFSHLFLCIHSNIKKIDSNLAHEFQCQSPRVSSNVTADSFSGV